MGVTLPSVEEVKKHIEAAGHRFKVVRVSPMFNGYLATLIMSSGCEGGACKSSPAEYLLGVSVVVDNRMKEPFFIEVW